MIRDLVKFYREHDYDEFSAMMKFMVPVGNHEYILEKYQMFNHNMSHFPVAFTDSNLNRIEVWRST